MSGLLSTSESKRFDRQFDAIRQINPKTLISQDERHRLTVQDAKVGGFIQFGGRTYQVKEVSIWQETNDSFTKNIDDPWTELVLFCLETGETVHIEWQKIDEIEISITTDFLDFSDLVDEGGNRLNEEKFNSVVENGASLFFNGEKFEYQHSYSVLFFRQEGDKESKRAFMHAFESDNGYLTFQAWIPDMDVDAYDFQICTSEDFNSNDIEILVTGFVETPEVTESDETIGG